MAKIYYTNGTGTEQTKERAVKPQFPVYDTFLDAQKDIDNLEVGQEIAVPDEFDIAGTVNDIIDEAIDTHLENKGSPIGTIISYRGTLPEGYLKTDGSSFDPNDYPLLYGQLRSTTLPKLFEKPDNYEYGKEYLVDYIDGRPVFRVDWIDVGQYSASNLGSSWYNTAGPDGDLNWFKDHNFDRIISSEVRAGHSGTGYESGQNMNHLVQLDSSTGYLRFYYNNQTQGTNSGDGKPRIFSIKYFRTDNSLADCEEIHWKAIKYTSGVEAESDTNITEAIEAAKQTIENFNPNPVGSYLTLANNDSAPAGYLLADGSEFDTEKYPLLYSYLGSNVLPDEGFELDYDNTEYLTYDGTTLIPQAATQQNLNTFTMAKSGALLFNFSAYNTTSSYGYIQVNGHLVYKATNNTSSWLSNYSALIPVKKGDVVTIYMTYTPQWFNYQSFIPYKYHKYIKAVSGIESGTTEATEVVAAIDEATELLQNLSPNPVGSYLKLEKNTVTPAGYLKCDGSTFDEEEYPLLYNYLGSNVLPYKSNMDSLSNTPDVAISTYATYCPSGVQYVPSLETYFNDNGLSSTGDGFPYDGYLFVETYHYYYLWIQDVDGTIKGYWVASRDDTQSSLWIPIKKGQKIYGWNRNGTSAPTPATTFVQSAYTKFYIWYAKTQQYIKAVSGIASETTEAQEVANAVASAEASFADKFATIKAELTALIHMDETVLAEGTTTATSATQAVIAGTAFTDSLLNYDIIRFYMKRGTGSTDYIPHYDFTHEEMVEVCQRNTNYSILIPGYASEYREMTFDSTGQNCIAVAGGACCWKVIGIGKRS